MPGVIGAFRELDSAVHAIEELKQRRLGEVTVYTPTPRHEIEHAIDAGPSPVRLFTLIGGLTGCAAGFGMTLWMSYDWPILVGGKPIGSIPPYVVIGFELTILLGALSTVAAVALFSVLMGKRGIAYDPKFSDDQIGIFVPSGADQFRPLEQLLRSAGAVEVRHEAA